MQYRKFGKSDFDVSILGYGCMRFPLVGEDKKPEDIDEPQAIEMIRKAIDDGVNYFDTAYIYHNGFSEVVLGKALKDGYREKVRVATKSPTFIIKEEGDFEKYLDEQLKRLDMDYIDYYLLHSLDKQKWEDIILKFDFIHKCEEAKKAGKIGHIGFSYHEEGDLFYEIVDHYDKWDFCQIQLNYLNETFQAGLAGAKYAKEKGLGVIIMEPLFGGKLANPSKKVVDVFKESGIDRSPCEWALDYLWNMPEVDVILSGMSNMQQTKDNIEYANRATVGMFSDKENQTIKNVQQKYKEIGGVPCSGCEYCMPCPHGVGIPNVFEIYNGLSQFDTPEMVKKDYNFFFNMNKTKEDASHCIQCGECAPKCPQRIHIPELMPKVHEELTKK